MPLELKTRPTSCCKLCGHGGETLYNGLTDMLRTTQGLWDIRQCHQCGLLWIDPMPLQEEIYKAYEEYPTHEDAETGSLIKQGLKRGYLSLQYGYGDTTLLNKAIGALLLLVPHKRLATEFWFKLLKGRPNGRLLDIGCGGGGLVKTMSEWGWQAEGIEPDLKAVLNARAKGIAVNHGNFLDYPYPDGSFDAVLSSHVLEHVYDPVGFLKKCWSVLKRGGIMLIATPNGASMQRVLFRRNWMALDPPRHLYLFSHRSLGLCAEGAGIENYQTISTHRGASFIATASMLLARKRAYHWRDRADFVSRSVGELIEFMEATFLRILSKMRCVELLFIAHKR